METKPVVLLSGFGPFGKHTTNASWAGVKDINIEQLENKHNIKLVLVEIPVVYKTVDDLVPSLWKIHKPMLVIHVGVSAQASKMTLETIAHGIDYSRSDCYGECPPGASSVCCTKDRLMIVCGLDVEKICEDYNKLNNHIQACISKDAGRYLCEYTFYTSLRIDSSRTLFVHVPDINQSFTANHIAQGLESIIELCLKQLNEMKCT